MNAELSFTVPGAVDGFITMLETYGTRTLAEVAAPAIDYACRGFPMYRYMRQALENPLQMERFRAYPPGGAEVFYPGGEAHKVGELLIQEQLGKNDAEDGAGGVRRRRSPDSRDSGRPARPFTVAT